MNKQNKMIAPVVVTILLIIYYLFIMYLVTYFKFPLPIVVIVCSVSVIISFILIYVCNQRIKEIKRGEEDDLSQY